MDKQFLIKNSGGEYACQQVDRNGMVFQSSDALSATKFSGEEVRMMKDRHREQWQNNCCKVYCIEIIESQVIM